MPDVTPRGASWARRDVLRLGLVVPLAGCTVSPAIQPRSDGSGTTTPSGSVPQGPAPTLPAPASAELTLAAYAAAILAGPHRSRLSPEYRTLLTFLDDSHTEHAAALVGDDPTSRPTPTGQPPSTSAPDLAKLSLADSLQRLTRLEAAQASAQRAAATNATGLAALLAGSLAVAAETYAAAIASNDPPSVAQSTTHRPAAVLTDVAAAQQLVAQLHAVVYGYQLAIGKLKYTSAARKRAVSQLAATRRTLDLQIAFLLDRKADVPAAEPAYVPSPNPRSPADAGRLVRGMLTRLEPFVGLILAAAGTPATRTTALTLLRSTTRTAVSWGSSLQVWPGWSD